ncbi:MAG TPA: SDR family oxidoreductase, partial [Armatimonadota bacterium]|nr:SDR family oxidoreductase [Armatimonadota bacterium]
GYVGGKLLRGLLDSGHDVRCLIRNPSAFTEPDALGVECIQGDALDPATLPPAFDDIDTAYYLIHSMGVGSDFEQLDRDAAQNFAEAAKAAGVSRIIYLGALAEESDSLSPHMRSRLEVGEILRSSNVPTLEFQASIIIGAGSLSFEIMRALVERIPIMTPPRWVRTLCQPISIHDVVAYLLDALDYEDTDTRIFQIGGAQQVSYQDLMREYQRRRGLKRLVIPLPFVSARISSLWLALITPLHFRVGRRLIESIGREPTVVTDLSALDTFGVRPCGIADSIIRALVDEDAHFASTSWSDELNGKTVRQPYGGLRYGPRFVDSHIFEASCRPSSAFKPIQRIGGDAGWYYGSWLWKLRGFIDRMLGGPGLSRGRRDSGRLEHGDTVDFWCVEVFHPGRRLRFAAEMKLPGRAWLDFEARESDAGALIRATAIFDPKGLYGLAYWFAVYPLHGWLFRGMLKRIAEHAETECELELTEDEAKS